MLSSNAEHFTEAIKDKALKNGTITNEDIELLDEFINGLHLSPNRKFKEYYILIEWRHYIGPYKKNTMADLDKGIDKLPYAKKPVYKRHKDTGKNGKWHKDVIGYADEPKYKKNTISDFVRFLKRYYFWLIDNGYSKIEEKKIKNIHVPGYDTMTKTVAQMLEKSEIDAIIKACQCSRDRAFMSMLYYGGFRISELINLKWRQVKIMKDKVAVNVNEKTGRPRYIPLYEARPYMAQWYNDYPLEMADDGYVFVTLMKYKKQQMKYSGTARNIRVICKHAGIKKKITPHLFRHSRITQLINDGVQESQIKLMMWGNIETGMFKTYAHTGNETLDNAMSKNAGLIPIDSTKKDELPRATQCLNPNCLAVNAPGVKFCGDCGHPLTEDAAGKLQGAIKDVDADPGFKEYQDKIKRLDELEAKIAALTAMLEKTKT